MKKNRASRTAAMVAATRAWHTKVSEQPVFDDPYALLFTPLLWQGVIRFAPLRKYTFENDSTPLRGIAAQVIGRSRYAEDCLWEGVKRGIKQYVMVGAGYDSFALRHPDQMELSIYELDFPATQQHKQAQLSRHKSNYSEQLHFVPVDFSVMTAGEALANSDYKGVQPTFFSWLGTTPYLNNEDTLATIASISSVACEGSELVFDYLVPDSCLRDEDHEMVRQLKEYTARSSEPILGAFHPEEISTEVNKLGFDVIENLAPSELEARYFSGREDSLRIFGATYFMRCRCRA